LTPWQNNDLQLALNTWGALLWATPFARILRWLRFTSSLSPLGALLPAALLKTQAAAGFTQRPSIQLLLVYGKAKQIRMALPQDAQEGRGGAG
jgi:hypothetical protein